MHATCLLSLCATGATFNFHSKYLPKDILLHGQVDVINIIARGNPDLALLIHIVDHDSNDLKSAGFLIT